MKKSCFSGVDNSLKLLLKQGVSKGVFSGAGIGLYKHAEKGGVKKCVNHGTTSYFQNGIRINEKTLFDLASLTKPLCTVLCLLHLIDEKKISLTTPVHIFFGTENTHILKKITIAHLLSHSSGLHSYRPFYKFFAPYQEKENKKKLLRYVLSEEPAYETGKKCVYSDLGFIILGEIVERVSGQPLDAFFKDTITGPLGLDRELLFRRIRSHEREENKNIAATQHCPWRNSLLQGEVDDEHSWLMNGVSGHAGLFGTVKGVLDMTTHILHQWKGREGHLSYTNSLLRKALIRQMVNETWCLGFDTPSEQGSSSGKYLSANSVGHLGFTGTSFWIDPEADMVIVLLTNRIHPSRENDTIKKFRPMLHNTVFELLEKKKSPCPKAEA